MLRPASTRKSRRYALLAASTVLACFIGAAARTAVQGTPPDLRGEILRLQEDRAPSEADVEVLLRAARLAEPDSQLLAVRALGRLERPSLVASILPLLDASHPAVRAEAANAIGQSLGEGNGRSGQGAGDNAHAGVAMAMAALIARLDIEPDRRVRGVICATLGRLPVAGPFVANIEGLLVRRSLAPGSADDAAAVAGAAEGLESLLRIHAKEMKAAPSTVERLRSIATFTKGFAPQSVARDWRRARRLALTALMAVPAGADLKTIAWLVEHEKDDEMRRLAVRAAGQGLRTIPDGERLARRDLLRHASDDGSAQVRYEVLTAYGRDVPPLNCEPFLRATSDPSAHVSLVAIDMLAQCASTPAVTGRLTAIARGSALASAWHKPAHALVALARVAPNVARAQLGRFRQSPVWQARTYAARAAAALRDARTLRRLAEDVNDNVRTAAVAGLADVEQHQADDVYIAQLKREDYQLLMTAARALKGTSRRAPAAAALSDALLRLTRQRHDTSRDPRLAIVDRLAELGSSDTLATLQPLTHDFDGRIASAAANACSKLSPGGRFEAVPGAPLPRPPVSTDEVRRLDGARALVRLKSGRTFTLTLLPWDAPATVSRFARLARSGYYDGLTFHRIVPNFIIQGGSPGANEFAGDATYWRDEVGLQSNERGTVGLSTRGRDTGDGQFYVNLVDNPRLDHTYTVFAWVSEGMDVVDGIVEGDVIQDVRIVSPPSHPTL